MSALRSASLVVALVIAACAAPEARPNVERARVVAPRAEVVVLTLHAPAGSYDPDASTITVLTTSEGKLGKRPLENVVHEMVHLGVERPIVRRFGLTHPEKERLVDAAARADLPAAVARYVAARPRASAP